MGVVSCCRRRRVRSASVQRAMAADKWLVRFDAWDRRLPTDRASVAKVGTSEDYRMASVRSRRALGGPRPYRTDGLAPAAPALIAAFHPNLTSDIGSGLR